MSRTRAQNGKFITEPLGKDEEIVAIRRSVSRKKGASALDIIPKTWEKLSLPTFSFMETIERKRETRDLEQTCRSVNFHARILIWITFALQ